METQHLISKKIDNNTHFVFHKISKKFLIFDTLYIDLFNQFYSLSKKDFTNYILNNFSNSDPKSIYSELKELSQIQDFKTVKKEYNYTIPQNLNIFNFKLGDNYFSINYDDTKVVNTIIGQLFHLKDKINSDSINYYIFKSEGRYFLNNNHQNIGSWSNNEIHYLTGKLLSLIMCDFHNVEEKKWAAFLHASTVSKDNNAIVIVGESGSGKSTSCAILSKNGFKLISDDTTPISREGKVGNFPNSISIKEPSFQKINDSFLKENLSNTINVSKGKVKYLNPHGLNKFNPETINCSTIVRIKYNLEKQNSLKKVKLKDLLPLIVNESFFPTNLKSIKGFMNWFINCKCYTLNFNNDKSLINLFKNL